MRQRRLARDLIAASLAVVVIVASGCTTSRANATTTTTTPKPPVYESGGTAVVAVPSLPTNFNPSAPQGANQITSEVMAEVLPQAFVTDATGAAIAEPGFDQAEVEGVSPFTVVYTLDKKAIWSDGVPITAADFVYNWHEQLLWGASLPSAGLVAGYRAISGITSTDNGSVVRVTFKTPFSEWESLFSNLVPAHIAEQFGWVSAFEGFEATKVVSGGPFEITSYEPGKQLTLSRNPNYWATPANLSRIILRVESSTQASDDLESGSIAAAELSSAAVGESTVAGAARSGVALTAVGSESPELWELCFNTMAPILATPDFRDGIEQSLYLGEIAADSVGVSNPGVAAYGFRLALGETPGRASASGGGAGGGIGGSGLATGLGGSGGSPAYYYDPLAAQASFKAAGYALDSSGALAAVGTSAPVDLSLVIPSGSAVLAEAASEIRAQLSAVGIELSIESLPLDEMLASTLPAGDYELALAPFLMSSFPASQAAVYSEPVLPGASVGSGGSAGSGTAGDSGGVGAGAGSTSTSTSSSVPGGSIPTSGTVPLTALPWWSPTAVGTEPGAVSAGVVTRDVFGAIDPVATTDLLGAVENLNPVDANSLVAAAEAEMALEVPTVPLFRQPVELVHETVLRGMSESPTWAGMFWNAAAWTIQIHPAITPTTLPLTEGVSGVSP